jgi:DNA-binding NarL/FixJ family response regulator
MTTRTTLLTVSGKFMNEEVILDEPGSLPDNYVVLVTFLYPLNESQDEHQDLLTVVSLSQSEKRILELVATGATNSAIAEKLEIGSGTVRNYVSSLLRKFKVANRSQLAITYRKMHTQLRK